MRLRRVFLDLPSIGLAPQSLVLWEIPAIKDTGRHHPPMPVLEKRWRTLRRSSSFMIGVDDAVQETLAHFLCGVLSLIDY